MHKSLAAIASCGASPIVRIAANEAWIVKSMSLPTSLHSYPPSSSSYHHYYSTNTILGALDAGATASASHYSTQPTTRAASSPQPSSHPSAPAASARRSLQGPPITRVPLPIPKPHPQPTNTSNRTCAHTPANPYLQGRSHHTHPRRRRPADRALSTRGTTSGA